MKKLEQFRAPYLQSLSVQKRRMGPRSGYEGTQPVGCPLVSIICDEPGPLGHRPIRCKAHYFHKFQLIDFIAQWANSIASLLSWGKFDDRHPTFATFLYNLEAHDGSQPFPPLGLHCGAHGHTTTRTISKVPRLGYIGLHQRVLRTKQNTIQACCGSSQS